MQNISLSLWFDNNAEEAMNFYTTVFGNAERGKVNTVVATFRLEDLDFIGINGGPVFKINPAISMFVGCDTEQEIDDLWAKLSEGGSVLMPLSKYPFSEKFGWLQDKLGLSWQLNLAHRGQKITPFLLFAGSNCGKAEEAARFYASLFKNSGIERMEYFGKDERGKEGTVKHGVFSLLGQSFMVMDSNQPHQFTFNEAVSFVVNCDTQDEVDHFWEKLSEGGKKDRCGWLKDKYGVSWQIVPALLGRLMNDPDQVKTKRVMDAMMKMNKLEMQELQDAYDRQ